MALSSDKKLESCEKLGIFEPLTVYSNPYLEGNTVVALDETMIFVSPNLKEDIVSYLKGEDVDNDALLKALEQVTTYEQSVPAPTQAVVVDDSDVDLDDDFGEDLPEEGVFGGEDDTKKKEKKAKTKTFKADKMANGFVFQANPLAEGKEPFYMEAYLLGNNEIYISGGMAGILNGDEAKQLRKQLKMLLNQLNESYPEPDKEKGGKAVLKVDAPWVPSEHQIKTVKDMVEKEVKKLLGDQLDNTDPETVKLLTKAATNVAVTTVAQLKHEPHDPGVTTPLAYDPSHKTSLEELVQKEAATLIDNGGQTVEDHPDLVTSSNVEALSLTPPVTEDEVHLPKNEIAPAPTVKMTYDESTGKATITDIEFEYDNPADLNKISMENESALSALLGNTVSNTATLYEDDEE